MKKNNKYAKHLDFDFIKKIASQIPDQDLDEIQEAWGGWDEEEGKSKRAVVAEEKGYLKAGQIAKKFKICTDYVDLYLRYEEWHHTSGAFNQTKYYCQKKVAEYLLNHKMEWLDYYKSEIEGKVPFFKLCKYINYYEWVSVRKRRGRGYERVYVEQKNVYVQFNGIKQYKIFRDRKKTIQLDCKINKPNTYLNYKFKYPIKSK